MIQVESLTKKIDGNVIVRDISFQVDAGEIMGFIGPNGAGKTTTLRMLACAMAPSSGTATLAGFDLRTQDHEIRKVLGYQPETPPLYPNMKVLHYLQFMAELRAIPASRRRQAVDTAIQKCRLETMTGREIGKLSKGYRQRVGLAQAILASPKILLLDEPTASLDPEQINETRGIIRNCAEDAAVIFSTHIMQEIQHLCDRIVVIKQGQVRYTEHIRLTRAGDTRRHLVLVLRAPQHDGAPYDALPKDGARKHDGAPGGSSPVNPIGDTSQIHPVATRSSSEPTAGISVVESVVAELRSRNDITLDLRPSGDQLKLYAAIPDDDALQLDLLHRLTTAGIPVLSVMPRESELEQTILHHMKN